MKRPASRANTPSGLLPGRTLLTFADSRWHIDILQDAGLMRIWDVNGGDCVRLTRDAVRYLYAVNFAGYLRSKFPYPEFTEQDTADLVRATRAWLLEGETTQ